MFVNLLLAKDKYSGVQENLNNKITKKKIVSSNNTANYLHFIVAHMYQIFTKKRKKRKPTKYP